MKPLPSTHAGPSPASVAAVRGLLGRLESIGETFALVALDDETLAPISTAVTRAVDLSGRWLVQHEAVTTKVEPDTVSDSATGPSAPTPAAPVVAQVPPPADVAVDWGDLFAATRAAGPLIMADHGGQPDDSRSGDVTGQAKCPIIEAHGFRRRRPAAADYADHPGRRTISPQPWGPARAGDDP